MWPGWVKGNSNGPLVPIVRDWYQWKSTLFQWFYWWICISLKGLRLFSHVTWLGTGQFRWSIGTNGAIGTNGKWCHSSGSIGVKQVHFYTKWKHANNYYERSSFYKKTTQLADPQRQRHVEKESILHGEGRLCRYSRHLKTKLWIL